MSASTLARKRAGQFTTETARTAGRIAGQRFAVLLAIAEQIDKQANLIARKYDRLAG